jgi:uncharacterized NAD(P)/FAD-binding protein YdhS
MHASVAIVGGGPRALSVLERICGLPQGPWESLTVHVIDPNPPGSGTHYPDQPDYLLMNTVAGQVTMFRTGDSAATGNPVSGPSLAEWAGVPEDEYLPRGVLGRYLADAFRRIRKQAPPTVLIQEHRATAETLRTMQDRFWVLTLSDGSIIFVDFVFLTTGHGRNHPTEEDCRIQEFIAEHRRANPRLRYFRSCYPLQRMETIDPGARVAVRGMGLSAIDTVAALTIGRGGRFVPGSKTRDLVYLPSGDEPQLHVFSRSCRIFWPRPVNQKGPADVHQAEFLTAEKVQELRREHGQIDFEKHLLPLLRADMLKAAESLGTVPDLGEVETILRPLDQGREKTIGEYQDDIVDFLRKDERRAAEGNLKNPVKAATDALRDIREELRGAIEHRGLTPGSHERFCRIYAPIMNAVAAGPPASRAAEWRALFAAGILHIGGGPGSGIGTDPDTAEFTIAGGLQSSAPTRCDVVVGATVDPFLPERDTSPLTRSLLSAGHARPFANGWFRPGGFDIDPAGRLIGTNGTVTPSICALGHITEGAHYFTNMLSAPGIDSRLTADAAAAVEAMREHLGGDRHRHTATTSTTPKE